MGIRKHFGYPSPIVYHLCSRSCPCAPMEIYEQPLRRCGCWQICWMSIELHYSICERQCIFTNCHLFTCIFSATWPFTNLLNEEECRIARIYFTNNLGFPYCLRVHTRSISPLFILLFMNLFTNKHIIYQQCNCRRSRICSVRSVELHINLHTALDLPATPSCTHVVFHRSSYRYSRIYLRKVTLFHVVYEFIERGELNCPYLLHEKAWITRQPKCAHKCCSIDFDRFSYRCSWIYCMKRARLLKFNCTQPWN